GSLLHVDPTLKRGARTWRFRSLRDRFYLSSFAVLFTIQRQAERRQPTGLLKILLQMLPVSQRKIEKKSGGLASVSG
ncbi:hypothetical protein ACFL27_05980, partial [candidate division CSSED10-310 bacterium]